MAGHRWIGYLVWAVLFGAVFVCEGIGLLRADGGFPTLSDAVRAVMRYPLGRWALFALWLWFGWHAFVRGWHFLLRGPGGESAAGTQPGPVGGPGSLIRSDLVPMVAGYVLVMGTLAVGWRLRRTHPQRPTDEGGALRTTPHDTGWPALIRRVLGTAVGGYLLLMLVVVTYYYAVARQGGHFLTGAATGAALLEALAVPVFLLASWWTTGRRVPHERAGASAFARPRPRPPGVGGRPRRPRGPGR